jgi:hypothetical protein
MDVRITKLRLAAAGLFVLAGVGLGSILSPLVGSALATVGSVVNISDHSSSAYFARVTSAGELKTNGVVSGKVAPALPPQPFYIHRFVSLGAPVSILGPTTATIAVTDIGFSNSFANQARRIFVDQYSAPAPDTSCLTTRYRTVAVFDLGSAETARASLVTPIVVKPLATGDAWCLKVTLTAPASETSNVIDPLSLGGYVLSGTFTTASAAEPTKARAAMP